MAPRVPSDLRNSVIFFNLILVQTLAGNHDGYLVRETGRYMQLALKLQETLNNYSLVSVFSMGEFHTFFMDNQTGKTACCFWF